MSILDGTLALDNSPTPMDLIRCEAGNASITIDPCLGARLCTLSIGDLQVLVPPVDDPMHWGSFPMVPWVGRIRHGRFQHAGETYQLPKNLGPHAIHGTTFTRTWQQQGSALAFEIDLGPDWPFAGKAIQRFNLQPDSLEMELEVHTLGPSFPAACGFHPWFQRKLSRGGDVLLTFLAQHMYHRDPEYITTLALEPPRRGGWDDCFKGVTQPVEILWPDALHLRLTADTDHWVVFNEWKHGFCVEAQTGPPDALNIAPRLVRAEHPLTLRFRLDWTLL